MVLDFSNDRTAIRFEPEEGVNSEHYQIKVYARYANGRGFVRHVYTTREHRLSTGENIWYINVDHRSYNTIAHAIRVEGESLLPNIIELSFKVLIDEEESEVNDILILHFVRYIPRILRGRGWLNAERLQNIWFTRGNNISRDRIDPELEVIDWSWIMSESSEARSEYEEFKRDTVSTLGRITSGEHLKNSLRSEIRKMIRDGLCSLPTASNRIEEFGTFDNNVVDHMTDRGNTRVPLFEKYYFNSKPFSGAFDLGLHYFNEGMDDLVAGLANFSFHVAAKGILIYETRRTKIKISQLAFYVKDSFDFIDEHQNLGYWRIINGQSANVYRRHQGFPANGHFYFHVTNRDYRGYRNHCNMGYNYYLYSNLNIQNVNIELTL